MRRRVRLTWSRLRRHTVLELVVVALTSAGGASAVALAASTSGTTSHPSRVDGAHLARQAASTTASNKRAAVIDAKRLLAGVIVPAGNVVRSRGIGVGGRARLLTTASASAVAYKSWMVSEDPSAVMSFVAAHLPVGSKVVSSGSGGPNPSSQTVIYSWPAIAGVLDVRWLEVEVTERADGGTALYAESQSQWVHTRSQGQQIPAGVGQVQVTDGLPRKRPFLTHLVNDQGKVRAIVAAFDSLGRIQPGVLNCPVETNRSIVTFVFRDGASGRTLARASVSSTANFAWSADVPGWACFPVSLNTRDHTRPALAGNIIAPIQRLLHIKLPSRG